MPGAEKINTSLGDLYYDVNISNPQTGQAVVYVGGMWTNSGVIVGDGSGLLNLNAGNISSGVLPVSRGGTGTSTLGAAQLLIGNGTSPVTTSSKLYWDSVDQGLVISDTGTHAVNFAPKLVVSKEIFNDTDRGVPIYALANVKGDVLSPCYGFLASIQPDSDSHTVTFTTGGQFSAYCNSLSSVLTGLYVYLGESPRWEKLASTTVYGVRVVISGGAYSQNTSPVYSFYTERGLAYFGGGSEIIAPSTVIPALITRAVPAQTANIQEWQNAANERLISIDSVGGLNTTASIVVNKKADSSGAAIDSIHRMSSVDCYSVGHFFQSDVSFNCGNYTAALFNLSISTSIDTVTNLLVGGMYTTNAAISNSKSLYVLGNNPQGTSLVTNHYGLYLDNQADPKITNAYAIYTNSGKVRFGDEVVNNAGQSYPITTVSSNTPLTKDHYTVLVSCSSANITITLPQASLHTGRTYNIKKIDATAFTVIIDGYQSETIDGSTTKVISTRYESLALHCDGLAWYIV